MKSFKPYAIAIILLVILLTMESCASRCARTRRYWERHRVVNVTHDTIPGYFYANNQIVIVEYNR